MKKLLLLLLFVTGISYAQTTKDVQGKWKDIKLPYKYDFKKTWGIFTQSGYPVMMDYKIDSTKTPMWIDFTVKGGRTIVLPGLMKWKGKDTLWVKQFPPYKKHPTAFAKDSTSNARKIHILVRE